MLSILKSQTMSDRLVAADGLLTFADYRLPIRSPGLSATVVVLRGPGYQLGNQNRRRHQLASPVRNTNADNLQMAVLVAPMRAGVVPVPPLLPANGGLVSPRPLRWYLRPAP